jgi:hypothetical protein
MIVRNKIFTRVGFRVFFKSVLFVICVLLTHNRSNAQGMSPAVQARVDSLNRWVQQQLKMNGKIDQHKLDSMNAGIRQMQQEETKMAKVAEKELKKNDQSLITKQGMLGTSFTVPKSKTWLVKRLLVSDNGGHNVLVTSVKFPSEYKEGEKIAVPSWTAESNLLGTDMSVLNYIFEIIETEIKK